MNRLTQEAETGGLTVSYTYDAAGNRTRMAVTGTEQYTTAYTYDDNNRLLTEARTENGETVTTTYTYDGNGNTLSKTSPDGTTTNTYNALNQLTGVTTNDATASYTYNAQGIRTSKQVGETKTHFLLDGGNVVAEVQNNTVTASYLRGINLISRTAGTETEYYLFNAHGDVVDLVNTNGAVTKSYDYDAFGNERNPSAADPNPFRYCGEYWDNETGTYYLRARYYAPDIGRFTQQDTHWNTANMIYGDTPQKINEREDGLGLKTYTYVPQIAAIMQSGNLYAYGINNPKYYKDPMGTVIIVDDVAIVAVFLAVSTAVILTPILVDLLREMGRTTADLYRMTKEELAWLVERAKSTYSTSAGGAPEDPDDDPDRKENPSKNESDIWKKLNNVKNSKLKTSGKGSNKRYYDWDYTHNDIEVYNAQGKHLGSMDPTTGEIYKPAVPGRVINVP